MKVGLIPPIPMLEAFGQGNFHLLLSHLCTDPKYRAHYRKQKRDGAYLIMDNAAHENGAGDDPIHLAEVAEKMGAQEVVVPDVLFDAEATVTRAIHAHEAWYEGSSSLMQQMNPQLMYVPQGRTRHEWAVCLKELLRLHVYSSRKHNVRYNFTLGVSKDYEQWNGGLPLLFAEYVLPFKDDLHRRGINMDVHLLGWGRELWVLGQLAKKYPWIRSTDSAKPFVYALDKVFLDPTTPCPPYPTRPANYFKRHLQGEARTAAINNVGVFKVLAGAK